MKKILTILTLATIGLCIAGCTKDSGERPETVMLGTSDMTVYMLTTTGYNKISGGSGSFSVRIDDPLIANVSIVVSETGMALAVEPLAEGTAVITVTDNRDGSSTSCKLTVKTGYTHGFIIDHVAYIADADIKEDIESDLANNEPYPVGSRFKMTSNSGDLGRWSVTASDAVVIKTGTFSVGQARFEEAYRLLPIDSQIYSSFRFNIDMQGEHTIYDMFVINGLFTRKDIGGPVVHARFYEDMTDHYRAMFPGAEVNAVVRVYIIGSIF